MGSTCHPQHVGSSELHLGYLGYMPEIAKFDRKAIFEGVVLATYMFV